MRYVDGYVVPVPKKNVAAYRRMAQKAGKVWRDHGALEYIECVADDVKPGKHTSFPQSVKLKAGETVVFAYIVYKSRADRDRINAKVMKDPRLANMMDPKALPFDGSACSGADSKSWSRAECAVLCLYATSCSEFHSRATSVRSRNRVMTAHPFGDDSPCLKLS